MAQYKSEARIPPDGHAPFFLHMNAMVEVIYNDGTERECRVRDVIWQSVKEYREIDYDTPHVVRIAQEIINTCANRHWGASPNPMTTYSVMEKSREELLHDAALAVQQIQLLDRYPVEPAGYIKIGDYDVPLPMSVEPPPGTNVYNVALVVKNGYTVSPWAGHEWQIEAFNNGLLHLVEDHAAAHAQALIALTRQL